MQPMQPPAAPSKLSLLPPDQQAAAAIRLYLGMADYAGKCTISRDALIDWINRQ
jgi:hypothetical protein